MKWTAHTIHVPGAHPVRDTIVARQRAELGSCIHEDPDRNGCMWNWLSALRCAVRNDDGDWTVILSDDALPFEGWEEHLPAALENSPADVIGLTHFGGFGETALKKGAAYGLGRNLVWGGAMAVRTALVRDLARMAHTYVAATGYKHDDDMVTLFQMDRGEPTALAARAIFGQPVKESLLGHNTPIREPKTTIENSDGPPWGVTSVATINRGSKAVFESLLSSVRNVMQDSQTINEES